MKYLAIILLLFLSACAQNIQSNQITGLVNADQVVRNTDWYRQDIIKVEFTDEKITPEIITVKKSEPTRLEITNKGEKTACFESRELFDAIAPYKITSEAGEVQINQFQRIKVQAQKTLDFWFVPLKEGDYRMQCTEGLNIPATLRIQ